MNDADNSNPATPSRSVLAAWVLLMRAQKAVLAEIEQALKTAGFPPLGWYDALLELRRAGQAGLRPLEIEDKLLLAQHNVSRLIDRLAAAGYVRRQPCATDGRGQMVAITPAGLALLEAMWPLYRDAIARHVGARFADDDEAEALAGLLGKLLAPSVAGAVSVPGGAR